MLSGEASLTRMISKSSVMVETLFFIRSTNSRTIFSPLYSGETIDIDLSNGFVVDISTLIVLSIMNFIDIIPKSFCSNIYITESLKNKFKYFYKTLSFKQEDKESNLYLTEDSKLILNEIMVLDQIKYWKKLKEKYKKILMKLSI